MGFVRVTLLRPYHEEHTQDLSLRFGSEPYAPMGVIDPNDPREYVQSGRIGESARPVLYTLNWSNESQRDVLMPEEAAMLHFGDWRLPKDGSGGFKPGANTYGREKQRVALKWGDYSYRTPDRGQEFTQDIIAPPNVPHVKIQRVDQGGRVVGDWSFDPWAWFAWDKDVSPRAVAREKAKQAEYEMKPSGFAGFDPSALSADQLAQMASLIAKQMKAKAS